MPQIDINTYGGRLRDAGYPGGVADMNPTEIESRTNEHATAIPFGVAVAAGAADDTCKPVTADGDVIIGISVKTTMPIFTPAADGTLEYQQRSAVPIAKVGRYFAIALETTARHAGVIAVVAQGGKLGSVTAGAAGAGRVAVPGAKWATATTAGNLGIVRVNTP